VRIDRGLEFAAQAVKDALAALCVDLDRLPGYNPHHKGKIERLHLTIEQTLLCGLPGYTKARGMPPAGCTGRCRTRPATARPPSTPAVGPMRLERCRSSGWSRATSGAIVVQPKPVCFGAVLGAASRPGAGRSSRPVR